ncbi:MAG: valine--tRNA ligase [Armatimonadetes bacterium]|nr:valine--tRNA ligase [Armatimonadota bacterium]
MEHSGEMSTRYDASSVESKWYGEWERAGLFSPDPDPGKPTYCITIPPPNITGSLHMGHALCYPIQDCLGRFHRLAGKSVLVLPGQDHAGIATQSVVSKLLRKEGTSPSAIGREKFLERVWEWRKESGDTILNQLRLLGCGFDWPRQRFTLDDAYAKAVLKVFVDWYDRGIIYRGKRVVNWDPVLETSVSDIETERRTVRGKLYHVRYPFADGSGSLVVATTRPETMLGDVAVAVNEKDPRYSGMIGKSLVLPLMNREIPLIADPYPDPEFGTGAVKVTPAHDPNDYEMGVRHELDMPVILDSRARVTELGGPYAGLDRVEARKRVVHDLEEHGFLVKVEDYDIPLLVSERSGEPIEPLLSEQWFVAQKQLAGPGIEAVKSGKVRFYPERYEKVYLDWMENIRDWCISRQLWWGHRIPVYYMEDGSAVAALSKEEAEAKSGKKVVRQDEDVLDTWFSSGLWPFATLGWPENTEDLSRYYPTSALITDRNIIYLWVARMIMMGMDFLGEAPFHEVFIYATVLTESGQRMSKSLGTGKDPTELIEKHGADALRFALLCQTGENQDLRFGDRRVEDARNFCNKLWNATRFVLMNIVEPPVEPNALQEVDQWLLSRLYSLEKSVRDAYSQYRFQDAAWSLYGFFWSELCDWYIEICKSRLLAGETAPKWVLLTAIEAVLKMLHPIMPHITEALYQHLPLAQRDPFLMGSSWPSLPQHFHQPGVEAKLEQTFAAVRALRALRHEAGLTPMKAIPRAYIDREWPGGREILLSQAWLEDLVVGEPESGVRCLSTSCEGFQLSVPVEGLDLDKECARLQQELAKAEGERARIEAQLSNPSFVERAKPEVVEQARQRLASLNTTIEQLAERRRVFGCSD